MYYQYDTPKMVYRSTVKVRMLKDCIGRRFPEAKIRKMREQLSALGVEYI